MIQVAKPEGDRKSPHTEEVAKKLRVSTEENHEGDRKGPHTSPHHPRPYQDREGLRQQYLVY